MRLIIELLIAAIFMLLVASPTIEFNPFKIQFERGYFTIGIILIGIGLAFIMHQSKLQGQKEGIDATVEVIQEILIDEKKNLN